MYVQYPVFPQQFHHGGSIQRLDQQYSRTHTWVFEHILIGVHGQFTGFTGFFSGQALGLDYHRVFPFLGRGFTDLTLLDLLNQINAVLHGLIVFHQIRHGGGQYWRDRLQIFQYLLDIRQGKLGISVGLLLGL